MVDTATIDPFLEPRHREIAARIAEFAAARLRPFASPLDDGTAREQARGEILPLLGESGWIRHAVPAIHGGTDDGPDVRALCLIREGIAAVSTLADAVFALQGLASMPIALSGTPEQQAHWLPRIVRGETMVAFAMTEPEAGSDVAAMRTVARREGDAYVLDGIKTMISNAGIADLYLVFAKTDPDAGRDGISCFLVESRRPGLVFTGAQTLSAPHPLGEIELAGCSLPASARVGAEGEGFRIGMATLDRLRPTVAAAACGMATRALREAVAHASRRMQFGKPLADQPIVRQKLARMATDLDAARLLTYRAAREIDTGVGRTAKGAAMAKSFAAEAAQRIVDESVQIHGGVGVLDDHPVDHLYRAVRALRIYEGTTEIQQMIVAREILKEAKG